MRVGDKVKIKKSYISEIAKSNPEIAKSLENQIGIIIEWDDIIWHFLVKFNEGEFHFRWLHLEEVNE